MVIVDAVVRLVPGVLIKTEATKSESFSSYTNSNKKTSLEYPQYTRPAEFQGWQVPQILLSGDHKKIKEWQHQQQVDGEQPH